MNPEGIQADLGYCCMRVYGKACGMVWEWKVEKPVGGFGNYVRYLETASIQAFRNVAYNMTICMALGQILANSRY